MTKKTKRVITVNGIRIHRQAVADRQSTRTDKDRLEYFEKLKRLVCWKQKSWRCQGRNLELVPLQFDHDRQGMPTYATAREAIDAAMNKEKNR